MPQNKLSPWVQALIAATLLAFFGGVLFIPALAPTFKLEADTKQTLFTLVTAVVFFFIGKNTDSARKDDQTVALTSQLASAVSASAPVLPDAIPPLVAKPDPQPPAH